MVAQNKHKGFALLIKAPRVVRTFERLKGETIKIFDNAGKEIWSIKLPGPIDNPGVTLHEVQIDLLTERDFGKFCENTWNRPAPDQPSPKVPTSAVTS